MGRPSRWWSLDLVLVVFLADAAGAAIYFDAPGLIRIPLAMLLVLLLPGYALAAVFFPASNPPDIELATIEDRNGGLLNPLPGDYELGGAERLGLSVVLSVAIVPAVAAVANFAVGGIALQPVLGGVLVVTVALSVVAFGRRLLILPDRRFAIEPSLVLPRPFDRASELDRRSRQIGWFNLVAVVGLVLLVASTALALAAPPQPAGFTEFYVVTDDATGASGQPYPSTFEVGQTQSLRIGIANHEHRAVRYTVVVAVQDGGGGPTSELGRAAVQVPDGATREVAFAITPSEAGEDLRLQFLLYRGDPPDEPSAASAYRRLDLAIDVTGS